MNLRLDEPDVVEVTARYRDADWGPPAAQPVGRARQTGAEREMLKPEAHPAETYLFLLLFGSWSLVIEEPVEVRGVDCDRLGRGRTLART